MDTKTVYGFILIGAGLVFGIVAKTLGVDGSIEITVDGLIAAGLFLITGIELTKKKGG